MATGLSTANVSGYLEQWLNGIVDGIRANMEAEGVNATGRTSASLEVRMTPTGGQIWGREHFDTLEIGRGPTENPGDGALFRNIREWIVAKGIHVTPMPYRTDRPHMYTEEERSLNAAAYAITKRIHERGTVLYNSAPRTSIYTDLIDYRMDDLMRNIATITIQDNITWLNNSRRRY